MSEIQNPRRILALGVPGSGVLNLLKDLTGSAPTPTSDTTAGLSHSHRIETKYYTATIPIWIDEVPDIRLWRSEFSAPEAREVVQVLGGWLYCFKKPRTREDLAVIKEMLQSIQDVIEKASGYAGSDVVCLAVGMPQTEVPYLDLGAEEWDDIAMGFGFEYVDAEGKGRNEFGEPVGLERIREVLRTADWEGAHGGSLLDDDEDGLDEMGEFMSGLDEEDAEMGMEIMGMKAALRGADDEEQQGGEKEVEELEMLMQRMQAIKDMGEGMPEAERKRFAAKAVNDLMKTL